MSNSEICESVDYGYIEGSFTELNQSETLEECKEQVFDFDEHATGMAWYPIGFSNCYA